MHSIPFLALGELRGNTVHIILTFFITGHPNGRPAASQVSNKVGKKNKNATVDYFFLLFAVV